MTAHPPTEQQQAARDDFATGRDVVIQARAGAGKTTLLRMLSEDAGRRLGLYTAFNKAIVQSAKGSFPRNVTAQTTFSIAYRAGGHAWKDRLEITGQTLRDVCRILGVTQPAHLGADLAPFSATKVARHALATVKAFCASADPDLTARHVPHVPGVEGDAHAALVAAVLPVALRAWDDMARPRTGQLRVDPSLYFKRWALSHPKIDRDFLMIDECQDTDAVLAGVLREQTHLQRVFVGDSAQAIYGWRGCVDVMGDYPDAAHLQLTKSFRFGPAIAAEANKWLELLDAGAHVEGHEPVGSVLAEVAHPDAVLTRSNAEAVIEAIKAHEQGVKVHLAGAGDEVRALAEAAAELQSGRETYHRELQAFGSWSAVLQYVEDGMASAELETTVRLLDTHGIETVVDAIGHTVAAPYADRIVTTTHKCKGLEWDTVRIADDWTPPKNDGDPVKPADAMLAYVAVTRAKKTLDRGGLAWVDRYVAQRRITTPTQQPRSRVFLARVTAT